jgi:hypothetical protein
LSAESSSIGGVVSSFGKSLDLAEEAVIHAASALSKASETFVFYRVAFGDSEAALVDSASKKVAEASELIRGGTASLEHAKQEIRDFSLEIAPSLALADSGKIREAPPGEELLDTSRRPRNIRKFVDVTAEKSGDVVDLTHATSDVIGGVFDLFGPPDPGGISTITRQQPAAVDRPTSGSVGTGDPVLTTAVTVVAVAKIIEIASRRLKKFLFGG